MTALNLSVLLADWEGGGHMDWDNGWGLAMMIGMFLFWGLVIVCVVWLLRGGSHALGAGTRDQASALDILDRRFAEGAIAVEEYKERRDVLTGGSDRAPGGDSSSSGA